VRTKTTRVLAAAVIGTLQVRLAPAQAPFQVRNVQPFAATAVSVTGE
jgi:hypothetical protein